MSHGVEYLAPMIASGDLYCRVCMSSAPVRYTGTGSGTRRERERESHRCGSNRCRHRYDSERGTGKVAVDPAGVSKVHDLYHVLARQPVQCRLSPRPSSSLLPVAVGRPIRELSRERYKEK